MSIISKETLMEYNLIMLGKGAPIEIDNTGYNKVDYSKMAYLSTQSDITDSEAYVLSTVLMKYSKTQLTSIATELKETVEHYQKLVKEVKVVDFTKTSCKLSWNFNRNISNFIKSDLDRTFFKWSKPNGEWVLEIKWQYIQQLLDKFIQEGFGVASIQVIQNNLDSMFDDSSEESVDITLKVSRPSHTIDTLVFEFPYNKSIVEVFKNIPYSFYNNSTQTWECYIEYSFILYKDLENLHLKGLNLSELKSWSDLVSSWGTQYSLNDLSQYTLPFIPYDFQPEDAKQLLNLKVGLNANDMGCGKTFEQVIIGESLPMRKLVICPPTLRINWRKEILGVEPTAKINILYSADDFKVVDGWNIIGYNSLDKHLKALEAENFQCIMIDEAHYIQAVSNSGTPDSKRAYAVLRLCATSNYVYPITGTPKTNRNKNMYNILRVIRHPLTRGKWAFMNYGKTYCDGQNTGYGWDFNGNSNDEDLNKQLVPFMVRHLKKDVLPNLKKQRIVTPVEVDLREYNYEISQYLQNRKNKNAEDLARLMRARKILAAQKVGESIDFAKSLIMEDKKVVVVTCFTEVVKAVEAAFKGNCVKLVGGMSDIAKDNAIVEFQTGEPQVMVMNIIAGGVGVTLTKSYNMVINDFDWTPGNLTQAEDRICRGGQTEEYCNIYYLYAEGADMDEVFAGTLTSKFDTINATVDGGNGDAIDYIDLLNTALEKSTGVKKVRRIVKVSEEQVAASVSTNESQSLNKKSNESYKGKTIEELVELANELGATYKHYDDPKIYRMRLVMAIKKQLNK